MLYKLAADPSNVSHSIAELGLDLELLFKVIHPFNRRNLFYEVRSAAALSRSPLKLSSTGPLLLRVE